MVTNVRTFIQDTSSTAQAFTDAQLTKWINTGLLWMYEGSEKRIKYVTLVADWDTDTDVKDGDASCLYPEILGAYIVDANGLDVPLEYLPWGDIRARQAGNPTLEDPPTHYSKLKYGGAAVSAAAQNLWKFALYPIPLANNNVIKGVVRDYPVLLSADADLIDLGEWEAECVEVIAAIIAAPRMGRPDLAQDLMGLLPKWIQDKLQTHATRDEVNA